MSQKTSPLVAKRGDERTRILELIGPQSCEKCKQLCTRRLNHRDFSHA
jgi:hypothetical protein